MSNDHPAGVPVSERESEEVRQIIRKRYGTIATNDNGCCTDAGVDKTTDDASCCSSSTTETESEHLGYDDQDTAAVADGPNLGLGCGNPKAFADMSHGETVLDLGAGAGFDCFLAAREVGADGRVIGVDMTPEMVSKARKNVTKNDVSNVEFRLGEIAHLPVADKVVDVVISNCVINLAPEKRQVFADTYRVLKPGGRIAISDVVQTAPFPDDIQLNPASLAGCVAGATTVDTLEEMLEDVGFEEIEIGSKSKSSEFISEWDTDRDLSEYLISATIEAHKPSGKK